MRLIAKLFASIAVLFGAVIVTPQFAPPAPRLAEKCDYWCTDYDRIMEKAYTLMHFIPDKGPDRVLIRICSKESMANAVSHASINPVYMTNWLSSAAYFFPTNKILISRVEGCKNKPSLDARTELWYIPTGADLPDAQETILGCQISRAQDPPLSEDYTFEGRPSYLKDIAKAIIKIRDQTNLSIRVFGYYSDHPNSGLVQRLDKARRLLKASGLSSDRYCVLLRNQSALDGSSSGYPVFDLLEIKKDCSAGR